jgi:CMP/dCMP kinase
LIPLYAPAFQAGVLPCFALSATTALSIIERTLTNDRAASNDPAPGAAPVLASVIAIDGPVASGKTTVGLRLARELGYRLVDTGMMYRAVTWLALNEGVDILDERAISALAASARIELGQPADSGGPRLRINGVDITNELRSPEVDRNVSLVSRVPGVREAMVRTQRQLASQGQLIMLGRDIGSVVLPDAPVKVYLDASARERARRRHIELLEAGVDRPEQEIFAELEQRDEMDRNRHASPLRPAAGALVIDTDNLSFEEVVDRVRAAATAAR